MTIWMQEGYVVYECNQQCGCNMTCKNRVLQNGVHVKLEVFRTEEKVSVYKLPFHFICPVAYLTVLVHRDGDSEQVKQFSVAHLYVSTLERF